MWGVVSVPRVRRYPYRPIVKRIDWVAAQRAMWNQLYGDQWHRVYPDGRIEQLDPATIERRDDGSYVEYITPTAFTYTTVAPPCNRGDTP